MHLFLKQNELLRVFHAVHVAQQGQSERLALPFFVSFAFPIGGKLFGGGFLLRIGYSHKLLKFSMLCRLCPFTRRSGAIFTYALFIVVMVSAL